MWQLSFCTLLSEDIALRKRERKKKKTLAPGKPANRAQTPALYMVCARIFTAVGSKKENT